MAVQALSPRSTNILRRPKSDMDKQQQHQQQQPHHSAKPVAESTSRKNTSNPKPHAAPPPALVREPTDEGEEYITGKFLGKGGFAICYEGRLVRNNRVFALKVVKSEMSQKKMAEKVRFECSILFTGFYQLLYPRTVSSHFRFINSLPIHLNAALTFSLPTVSHRAPNTLQATTSKHRRLPSRIRIREKHIRRSRTLCKWLRHGHG